MEKTYWNTVSADESYVDGQQFLSKSETTEALVQANKSINKNSLEPRYYYGRAKIFIAQGEKELALADLEKAEKLNPNNLVTLRNMVPIYYYLAIENIDLPANQNNINNEYLKITKAYYQRIKHFSPNDVGIPVLLIKYEKRLGLEKEAQESYEIIKGLRPDLLEWHQNIIN